MSKWSQLTNMTRVQYEGLNPVITPSEQISSLQCQNIDHASDCILLQNKKRRCNPSPLLPPPHPLHPPYHQKTFDADNPLEIILTCRASERLESSDYEKLFSGKGCGKGIAPHTSSFILQKCVLRKAKLVLSKHWKRIYNLCSHAT